MGEEKQVHLLLQFLFGEAAAVGEQAASERFLRWSQAFDDWLAERQRTRCRRGYQYSPRTWRRLLEERRKLPWELAERDLEEHVAWLQAEGYSASTIHKTIFDISNFYQWCGERGVDPQCGPDFNPAAGVKRPKRVSFVETDGTPARVLSREEVAALLGVVRQDRTPLGRREYAFCLSRLNLGVTVQALNRLQWGQISPVVDRRVVEACDERRKTKDEKSSPIIPCPSPVAVQWRAGAEPQPLPDEAWAAIREYLEAAGRLAGMQAGSYIFAPLKNGACFTGNGGRAEDWVEGRPLSCESRYHSMKVYGRAAGIEARKLSASALRRTAVRLKMESFEDGIENHLEEMKAFLDSESVPSCIKYKLSTLAQLPADQGCGLEEAELKERVPVREAGQTLTHGAYARSQPPEPIAAILAEKIQGMQAELAGLRALGEGLIARLGQVEGLAERTHLFDIYTRNAARLGELMKKEKAQQDKDKELNRWMGDVEKMCRDLGYSGEWPPERDSPWWGDTPDPAGGGLEHEIAAGRYVLRSLFQTAQATTDTAEYVRLADLYGEMCWRLGKLLRLNPAKSEFQERFKMAIEQAIREVSEEFKLEIGGERRREDDGDLSA